MFKREYTFDLGFVNWEVKFKLDKYLRREDFNNDVKFVLKIVLPIVKHTIMVLEHHNIEHYCDMFNDFEAYAAQVNYDIEFEYFRNEKGKWTVELHRVEMGG